MQYEQNISFIGPSTFEQFTTLVIIIGEQDVFFINAFQPMTCTNHKPICYY